MTFSDWMNLIGGIGLFLYGMNLLSTSVEKLAGSGLEKTLEKLASTRIRAMLLGIVVTAVIQSSSATSIMVVGFVNVGIMNLTQGVAVMMGANIGTTVTGQILRLGDLSSVSALSFLSPSSFSPLLIALGAFLLLTGKKRRRKLIASAVIGFGIIFTAMSMIESGMNPLQSLPAVHDAMVRLENPLLGLLTGILFVSVLQSASASVGVLQAISASGGMTFAMTAPIILGINIGKFVPVILASSGTTKKAKRAILINIMICVLGAGVFLAALYLWQAFVGFSFWESVSTRSSIANFNTLFNLATTALMFPWCDLLVKISGRLTRDTEESRADRHLAMLDARFLRTPAVALEQARKVISAMAETGRENFGLATGLLTQFDAEKAATLDENENFLDRCESALGEYIMQINTRDLDREKTRISQETALAICDFERIGDYCVNIADVARYMQEHSIRFSEEGQRELGYLIRATTEILDLTADCYRYSDAARALCVEPLEETVDEMLELLKQRHTDRLERGVCNVQRSISFMDLFGNIERIADHCSNVAVHVLQRLSERDDFDAHRERNEMHKGTTSTYRQLYDQYRRDFIEPLRIEPPEEQETGE